MEVTQSSFLPDDYRQSISENYVFFLLEKVFRGRKPNKHTMRLLAGCETIEEVITRISESDLLQDLFLQEEYTGLGRLGEFYIAMRCGKEWAPRAGFDIWGAFEYHDLIEVGKIEVKTCKPTHRNCWNVRITNTRQQMKYDVLVFIGLTESFNPSKAAILVIPRNVLEPVVEDAIKAGKKGRLRITISTARVNAKTGGLSRWYEFECLNHARLGERITKYVHGDFVVSGEQMTLFDWINAMALDD